jgi:uncharacterized damage-inducible protein DinB
MNTASDKLQILQETIKQITNFAEKFPLSLVTIKPDIIAFSANEIIYHLLEVEELWQRRIHQLLHTDDRHFQQIDPDTLAKMKRYNQKPYDEGIAKWKAAREETIKRIDSMTGDQLHIIGVHSRYGEMDTLRILDIMAEHDLQHLRQMERTLKIVLNN